MILFTFRAFRQGRLWRGVLVHPVETKDQQLQAYYNFAGNCSYGPNASLIHSFRMIAGHGSGFANSIVDTKPPSDTTVIKLFISIEPPFLNTLRELSLTGLTYE